jgi:hypothetical protein
MDTCRDQTQVGGTAYDWDIVEAHMGLHHYGNHPIEYKTIHKTIHNTIQY